MNRTHLIRRGISGAFFFGLLASGAIAACSAGSNSDNRQPGGGTGANGQGGGIFLGAGGGGGAPPPGAGGDYFNPGAGGDAVVGAGGATTDSDGHIGPQTINNCADPSVVAGGGAANQLLYPYDGTVFPRGLGGPLLMWNAQADHILITAKSGKFSYTDCPATPDKVRFAIPDDVWAGAGSWSDGPGDPLVITVTAPGAAPVTINVMFALATLKGAIYYNTYGTPKTQNNGAVMKLIPGQPAPSLFLTDAAGIAPLGPCRSCHALSANGMTMTANHHLYPGTYISESYDVTGPTPTLVQQNIPEAGFAAIFPDGSRLMTNGPPAASISAFFPTAPGDVTALVQGTSKMLDPKTGQEIPTNGWTAPHAQMPMFSPDGKHIVYNDADKGSGHSLWVADFDASSNTFSGQRQIFNDATMFAAWPFFTPDSKQVVFAVDSRPDFTSQVPDPLGATFGFPPTAAACASANPKPQTCVGNGHLVVVDVASATATKMDLANGYKGGQSYLPAGAARDNELEFFPTVSPIAAGGFFWAMFTSRRTYGNLWTPDIEDPAGKKIWVTAISIDAPAGQDPSHPAFLLNGQDIESGNIRAFAALEPCKEDGQKCSAGSECCKGHCTQINPATGIGICGDIPTNTCSRLDDKCAADTDCCTDANNGASGRKLYCIAGFCALKSAK